MWPSVPEEGLPLCRAIVTLRFPIAIPPSNSNSFFKPRTRSNHLALRFGFRTANPKCPTTPTVNGIFLLISLKKRRQATNRKSRYHRHRDKSCRCGGIKILSRNRANAHCDQTRDDDQCDGELPNRGAPFAQPPLVVRIATTLTERSKAQTRERSENQSEIAEIQH